MIWQRISEAVGMAEGGTLRGVLDSVLCSLGIGDCRANHQVAFTAAVVALSAKMAKADGVASQVEYAAFERFFDHADEEARNVRRLFDLAKRDIAGFDTYARQIAGLLADEPQLKRDVFEGLFYIAAADGVLHGDEDVYLRQVSDIFGLSPDQYRSVRAMFVHDPDDAYVVLGVPHDTSDDALRAQYRKLVRENHPDAMIARGVPEEFIGVATRKMAAINEAYERIARERGL